MQNSSYRIFLSFSLCAFLVCGGRASASLGTNPTESPSVLAFHPVLIPARTEAENNSGFTESIAESLRDSASIALLDSVLKSMIPSGNPATLGDLRITGTVSYAPDSTEGHDTFVLLTHSKQFRMDESGEGRHTKFASTGKIRFDKGDGAPTTLPNSHLLEPTTGLLPFDHWSRYQDPSVAVMKGVADTIDGIPCTRIDVAVPLTGNLQTVPPANIQVFIRNDQKTIFAIRQPDAQTKVYSPRSIVEYRYSDYKQFDGAFLPTTVSRVVGGLHLVTWHIRAVNSQQSIQPSDLEF